MSKLFFLVTWPNVVRRFRELEADAKVRGFRLTVKNANTHRLPVFLFYIDRKNGKKPEPFADLDEVASALAAEGGRT